MQAWPLERESAQGADGRFLAGCAAEDRKADQEKEGQDEVEDRPRRHRGRPRPKGCPRHRVPPLIRRKACDIALPDRRGVGIAKELDIAAKGDRRDLPAGAALVGAAEQDRAEADREHLGMDA